MSEASTVSALRFSTFAEFYPFYLGEHKNTTCRILHFIGSSIALALTIFALISAAYWLIGLAVIQGYAWAWIGHFGFEKNKPASFKQPLYSFMGDWVMWFQLLTGKIKFSE
jgi:hypothetical protein